MNTFFRGFVDGVARGAALATVLIVIALSAAVLTGAIINAAAHVSAAHVNAMEGQAHD